MMDYSVSLISLIHQYASFDITYGETETYVTIWLTANNTASHLNRHRKTTAPERRGVSVSVHLPLKTSQILKVSGD